MVMGSKFKPDDKSKISSVYKLANGNAAEAVRQLKQNHNLSISTLTIRTYWKKAGYEINSHGGKRVALHGGRGALSDKEIQKVLSFHEKYDGHPYRASLNEPYSPSTIEKYWKLNRLEIKKRINKRKSIDDIL